MLLDVLLYGVFWSQRKLVYKYKNDNKVAHKLVYKWCMLVFWVSGLAEVNTDSLQNDAERSGRYLFTLLFWQGH
jgi:hypothetical protein